MKIHNFSAGPSVLPLEVTKKAAEAAVNYMGSGLSIMEMSHRSKEFISVMEKVQSLAKELLSIPETHDVLFLQGGASLEFIMVPYNLIKEGAKSAYLDTGSWSSKAIKEAKNFGEVDVVASSKDKNYNYIPKFTVPEDVAYLHYTSNNTIYGTQMDTPEVNVPLVCDMSSDIFSKAIDFSKFDVIYAGAQKNMGPAGVTFVIVRKEALGKSGRSIPSYLDYSIQADKGSMFNTPPVFSVYVSMLTLEWLKAQGGVSVIEKKNQEKADLLYREIDRNSKFQAFVETEDRSIMNVTFTLSDDLDKEAFDAAWNAVGIISLNGHRSVGGYRASIYNAMPLASVQVLVDVMREFEKDNA